MRTRSHAVLLTAAALLALAGTARADDKYWNAGFGNWGTGSNWFLAGVPGAADDVYIGNTIAAENAFVTLNVNATIASLTITDGMVLDTDTSQLTVTGHTNISGQNGPINSVIWPSRLQVWNGVVGADAILNSLTVENDAWLEIEDGGTLRVNGYMNVTGTGHVYGQGTLNLHSNAAVAFTLNGSMQAAVGGFTINQNGTGRIDLDGNVAGDRTINITGAMIDGTDFARLTINGTGLLDDFDDDLWLSSQNVLTMNLSEGWTMGGTSLLRFSSGSHGGAAQVNGAHLDLHADLEFIGSEVWAQFNAPVTLHAAVFAGLGEGDRLEFNGQTTVDGGVYTLGEDARVNFDGDTLVRAGTFTTFSSDDADGAVNMNGHTTYDGDITVNGVMNQNGHASVTGQSVINADVFDMDGVGGSTQWVVGERLTINAASIDSDPPAGFDGTITIAGGFLSRLTVNIDGASPWAMRGTMNLSGDPNISLTRLSGTPVSIQGALNIEDRVTITADTRLAPGSTTTFDAPSDVARFLGTTRVAAGAAVVGGGTLHNGAGGHMFLEHGANLSASGVLNDGLFEVGSSPGSATVNSFVQSAGGSWLVEIGGYAEGAEHDILHVAGPAISASLAGAIQVNLLDLGNGLFIPNIGDQFRVMVARLGREGVFANDPVTQIANMTFEWTVLYTPTEVWVRLDTIVPAPGAAALMVLGVLAAGRRRR